jgi:hypothetical protein
MVAVIVAVPGETSWTVTAVPIVNVHGGTASVAGPEMESEIGTVPFEGAAVAVIGAVWPIMTEETPTKVTVGVCGTVSPPPESNQA